MERVGLVIIHGLIHPVYEPTTAHGHALDNVKQMAHHRSVWALSVTFLLQKGDGHHVEEHVIVPVQSRAANRREPSGDLIAFPFVEWFPKPLTGSLKGKRERRHFDRVLMVIGGGPPIFFAGRISA